MNREQMINLFSEFVKEHWLTSDDLITIMDLCCREYSSRNLDKIFQIRKIWDIIKQLKED